jgi:hypothetical protein
LIRSSLSITSVLDESTEIVSITAAPWAAVLVLTALPYRFLQAIFFDQLFEAGSNAAKYGNLLGGTANLIVLSLLLALWGRAVYARACRLALGRRSTPGRETWRVPVAALVSYILTSSTVLLLAYVSVFTCLGIFLAAALAGLAIGTMELNERVSLGRPFRLMFRHARMSILLGLVVVFSCALVVAMANLGAAFGLIVWSASGLGGFDAPHWHLLFTGQNRRFLLLILAGAFVAIEPFWIAAHVVFVRKAGAEERGDDLRAWFEELRRAS